MINFIFLCKSLGVSVFSLTPGINLEPLLWSKNNLNDNRPVSLLTWDNTRTYWNEDTNGIIRHYS